jgi:hypothetical protein
VPKSRELAALGLVTVERERVERVIKGRKRVVWGAVHYFVHRQPVTPKNAKNRPILLKSFSSTVEQIDSQSLSNPPVSDVSLNTSAHEHNQSHQSDRDSVGTDDDFIKAILENPKTKDPQGQIAAALAIIKERAHATGVKIQSVKYYEKALENFNFESGNDREELLRRLRTEREEV